MSEPRIIGRFTLHDSTFKVDDISRVDRYEEVKLISLREYDYLKDVMERKLAIAIRALEQCARDSFPKQNARIALNEIAIYPRKIFREAG